MKQDFNFAPATAVELARASADAKTTGGKTMPPSTTMPPSGADAFETLEPSMKVALAAAGVTSSNYADYLAGKFQPKSLGGIFDLLPKNTGLATKEQSPSIKFTVAEIRVIPVAARIAELKQAQAVASANSLKVLTQQIASLQGSKSPVVVAIAIKAVSSLKADDTWEASPNCTLEYRGQIDGLDILTVGGEYQLNCRKNYLGKKPSADMAAAHDRKSQLNETRGFDKLYDGSSYMEAVEQGTTYWYVPNQFIQATATTSRR